MIRIRIAFNLLIFVLFFLPTETASSIYGVRWMLGDTFGLPSASSESYILMFNSPKPLSGDIYLQSNHTNTACSTTTFTTPLVTTIYKCILNIIPKPLFDSELNYEIIQ